jgi:8-oxo-dGTP pyrophosphatase MutT (NUDIX family)
MMPAVGAIVRDAEGRILLQQQHDDGWTLPGGAMEPGETPALALVREVFEETGLVIEPRTVVAVLGGASSRVIYANGDEVEYVSIVFECVATGGSLSEGNDETKKLAYFAVSDMPTLTFPIPRELFPEPRKTALFA